LALLTPAVNAAQPPEWLLGNWILNSERTHELQPEQSSGGGSGFGSPSISVGGVFIPLPGGSQPSTGGARDPNVLRCASMTVAMQGPDVHFSYTDAGEEVMKAGNDQGRKSSWNTSKLTQKYTTTSRSVTKTYQLQSDGLLVVKVKINPKGSKSVTHVRVFQRPESLTPEA
jgi:hypothetical protein